MQAAEQVSLVAAEFDPTETATFAAVLIASMAPRFCPAWRVRASSPAVAAPRLGVDGQSDHWRVVVPDWQGEVDPCQVEVRASALGAS